MRWQHFRSTDNSLTIFLNLFQLSLLFLNEVVCPFISRLQLNILHSPYDWNNLNFCFFLQSLWGIRVLAKFGSPLILTCESWSLKYIVRVLQFTLTSPNFPTHVTPKIISTPPNLNQKNVSWHCILPIALPHPYNTLVFDFSVHLSISRCRVVLFQLTWQVTAPNLSKWSCDLLHNQSWSKRVFP